MSTHILMRRDTASGWNTINPVLMAGEFGLETDTLKMKMGNGSTPWTSLQYAVIEEFTTEEKSKLSSVEVGAQANPRRISPIEKSSGTSTDVRGLAPSDIRDMIQALAPTSGDLPDVVIDGGTPSTNYTVICDGGTP